MSLSRIPATMEGHGLSAVAFKILKGQKTAESHESFSLMGVNQKIALISTTTTQFIPT